MKSYDFPFIKVWGLFIPASLSSVHQLSWPPDTGRCQPPCYSLYWTSLLVNHKWNADCFTSSSEKSMTLHYLVLCPKYVWLLISILMEERCGGNIICVFWACTTYWYMHIVLHSTTQVNTNHLLYIEMCLYIEANLIVPLLCNGSMIVSSIEPLAKAKIIIRKKEE